MSCISLHISPLSRWLHSAAAGFKLVEFHLRGSLLFTNHIDDLKRDVTFPLFSSVVNASLPHDCNHAMVVIVVPLTNSVLTIDPSAIEILNKIIYSVNIRSLMLQTLPRYMNIGGGK